MLACLFSMGRDVPWPTPASSLPAFCLQFPGCDVLIKKWDFRGFCGTSHERFSFVYAACAVGPHFGQD